MYPPRYMQSIGRGNRVVPPRTATCLKCYKRLTLGSMGWYHTETAMNMCMSIGVTNYATPDNPVSETTD